MKFAVIACLLVGFVATLLNAQTPYPSSSAGVNATALCDSFINVTNSLDALLYESGGLGAIRNSETGINWDQVQTYLAPNFRIEDYSVFPSYGNYTSYREYGRALNRNNQTYPLIEPGTLQWGTCDPINRRLISQWLEPFALARNTSVRENSTSIYVTEFAPDSLAITRQAYWTSGNVANLTRPR